MKRAKVYDKKGITRLAGRLKTLRKQLGVTQEELAHKTGLTLSQIARIETAMGNPTVSTIFRISRGLGVKPSDLFDFEL